MTENSAPILSIRNLSVHFDTADARVQAVNGIDVELNSGECLGIVGESGSGKSQSFLAIMGLLSKNGWATGNAWFHGHDLLSVDTRSLNRIRGSRLSMIFQDPLTSLTPHLRIGQQMSEVLRVHQRLDKRQALAKSQQWLDRVHIPDAGKRLQQHPHELSGGMRQRVMIAMAMLCQPDVLIADEPTTALDVTIQAEILDLMNELKQEHGTAIVLITHDMGVVARMCDRVQVMRHGEYVEQGSSEAVFYNPQHEYTRMLLDAVPRMPVKPVDSMEGNASMPGINVEGDTSGMSVAQPETVHSEATVKHKCTSPEERVLLDVESLRVEFSVNSGWFKASQTLVAVDSISFTLNEGETLGIVGESGSGKSTLARAILQLLPYQQGSVSWLGSCLGEIDKSTLTHLRRDLQIVFQDPLASLNPSLTIGDSIMEPLRVHEPSATLAERADKVASMMHRVGLDPNLINRYPHELSGGQNQRVGIARAMILQPRLIVCDEAVSALDVSIQAQVIELLRSLQEEFGLSLIFISHDLAVVHEIAHRIAVMYLGSMMELAPARAVFERPQHPYTQQLVSAVPIADPRVERQRQRIRLQGELTSALDPRARLRFLPSALQAGLIDHVPLWRERFDGHFVAEHDPIESLLQPVVDNV